MGFILLTNDDGVDSPALPPFVRALSELAPVRAVVPDRERSWIGKAITRQEELRVERVERDGVELHTVSGYPADCTQLGVHSLFDERPSLVVSGINVGFNHGLAFLLSSGTVGGASEGWIAGLPALAFSAGDLRNHADFALRAWSPKDSRELWERAAALAADVVRDVTKLGFPPEADVVSVNFPHQADLHTRRAVTRVAKVGYEELFEERGPGRYAHAFRGGFRPVVALEGTDVEASERGWVSITPIRLAHAAELPEAARKALERG